MKNKRHFQRKVPRIRKKRKITYQQYSGMCKFRFNVKDFPKEFDILLLEKHGWFCPSNMNGVTRDHMLSISHGWKKDISPSILSHPANCQLMLYEANKEKAWKSSINPNELLKRIEDWNKKYKYLHK